ncbi:hypothetical protein [Vibrio alginolyticus]|uniref:hypothetical protein n=1 Tax=Vibrio alginolyticus TaxID=663 RepID=UPI001EEE495A|nr:hypothetical protein [Vibrio alginolyticus]ULF83744.1 hypothetical protein K6750_06560 [Vibrio alginolyticus]
MWYLIKTVDPKINWVTLGALASIVATDLCFNNLPELFNGGAGLLNAYYNICIGMVVSYVFFLIVVQRKELKDKEHIQAFVIPKLDKILTIYKTQLKELASEAGVEYDESYLSENAINDIFSRVNPNKKNKFADIKRLDRHSWHSYVIQGALDVDQIIKNMYEKINFLEPELVKLLSELEECSYVGFFKANPDFKMGNDNMSLHNKHYHSFSLVCEKLEQYKSRVAL